MARHWLRNIFDLGLLDPDEDPEEVVGRIEGDRFQDRALPLVKRLVHPLLP